MSRTELKLQSSLFLVISAAHRRQCDLAGKNLNTANFPVNTQTKIDYYRQLEPHFINMKEDFH